MKLRELSTAIDKALDVGSSVTGATGLGAAAAQAIPKLKSVAAKVVPGANIAYQAIDTAKRAKAGDVVGAGIAAASANPVGMWVGPAVQALRDKVRTGSYFPSDEEIQAAVAKDKKAGGYWKSQGSDFDPSYMPENQEQDAVATNARTRRLLNQIKGQFPQAQNDIEALLLYIDATNQVDRVDINRLDQENDQEEADIARIDTEVDAIQKTTKTGKVSEVLNPAMSFEEYSPFMKEVSKPLKIKIKHPPMTAQEKLYKRQQELRKKSGLPDPQYYKDLGEKLRKELEDLRREETKESLRPGEYHHFETDPKTGKKVYKGIRFDRVGGSDGIDKQGDEQERRDREERAMRQYDRNLKERDVTEVSNFGKNIFFKIPDAKLELAKQIQKSINFHNTKKPGIWKFSIMKNQNPAKIQDVIDQLTKYFGKPIDINKADKIQEVDATQTVPDPQKLIARVFIDGQSKDYDLTGMFKGDVKSQLNQASDFIINRLEASGIDYNNLELYYQGARLKTTSVGNVNIGAVKENDVVDQAMARYKSPEMKAQSQAIDRAFASGDQAEFDRLGIMSPQQIERDYQAMRAKEPAQDAALMKNPKLTPSARTVQNYNPKGVPVRERDIEEAGPFSYGAKKPRKGSVADLAAKKRKEQEKDKQPVEPKDHRVGVARVIKDVTEGGFDIPEIPRAPQPRPVPKDTKVNETDEDNQTKQIAKDIEYIKKQGYGKFLGKIAIPKILKLIRDEQRDWEDDDLPESDHHLEDENMNKFNGEYDDEAGMAHTNLITIARAADDLLDTIDDNENLPEWVQEKIAKVEGMLVSVWDYLKSQEAQGIDPRIMETYARLAEDWQKVNKRDKTDGMSRKAVKAYRRENPGSKLKTAVTTKPSKLKKGSKASKRRKSFCARMKGMKKSRASAKTKRNPDSPINKALRRWNCESVEDMQQLVMIAEQKVATARVEAKLRENLNKWFKEKWVRFGPDGKIRGECGGRDDSEGKPKCLPASKAHALGKKGRASAGARKRREDPNPERSGPAINVATKKKTDESQLAEKCWDTHKQVGMKKKGSRMVPNCVPKESVAEGYWQDALKKAEAGRAARKGKPFEKNPASHDKQGVYKGDKDLAGNPVPKRKKRGVAEGHQMCPECGGKMYPETMINEKKDACYYKVKSRYKVWPSAYASGALVKCRKKGAKNWGSKS